MASGIRQRHGRYSHKIKQELLCGICHETMKRPKTLTKCSHSFCQSCLETLFRSRQALPSIHKDQLECPTCRQVTSIPQGEVTNLATIHTIQNLAEFVAQKLEGDEQEQRRTCQKHGSELNQYCTSCNELLCGECIHDPKHREHMQRGIQLISHVLPQHQKALYEKLQGATKLASRAEQMEITVRQKREVVSSNAKQVKDKIEEFFKEVGEHVEERKTAPLSAVERNTESKLGKLEEHAKQLAETRTAALGTADSAQTLCQSSDIHVLTKGKVIDQETEEYTKLLAELDTQLKSPALDIRLGFQGGRQVIGSLGTLVGCETGLDGSLIVKHEFEMDQDGTIYQVPSSMLALHTGPSPWFCPGVAKSYENTTSYGAYEPVAIIPESPHEDEEVSRTKKSSHPVKAPVSDREFEDLYDNIPGATPPLPPQNPSRRLGKSTGKQTGSNTYIRTLPRSTSEIIQPVKVINNDELHDPRNTETVFPTGIHCSHHFDNITITDVHNHCLKQVDRHGVFSQSIGTWGKAAMQFDYPTAVAFGTGDNSYGYVVEKANARIQKVTFHGESVCTFGTKHLQHPQGIAVSNIDGSIYVSDSKKLRVYVYRSDGSYVRTIGKHEKNIHFQHPVGVAFDTAGNLLVVDRGEVPCIWHISQPEVELLGKIGEGHLHYPFKYCGHQRRLPYCDRRRESELHHCLLSSGEANPNLWPHREESWRV